MNEKIKKPGLMDEKIKELGQLNEVEIDLLKKQHGEVYEIAVPVDDEGNEMTYAYIARPKRKILEAVFGIVNVNPIQAADIILKNCWLAGNELIKTDDDLFMAAAPLVLSIIKIRQGEIKKK